MKHTITTLRNAGVRFLHFRKTKEDGSLDPQGGTTVAYVRKDDKWHVGYALCREACAENPKADTFNRKLGALIAGGRAMAAAEGVRHSEILAFNDEKDVVKHLTTSVLGANADYVRSVRAK